MAIHLVVTRHFKDYKPGDRITDEKEIVRIRNSSNHANAVPVKAPPSEEAAAPTRPAVVAAAPST